MAKKFEPLSPLDRVNLQELITEPRFETFKKLCERLKAMYELNRLAPASDEESEFQFIKRQFVNEGAIGGINELLIYLESESYPEEKPLKDESQEL